MLTNSVGFEPASNVDVDRFFDAIPDEAFKPQKEEEKKEKTYNVPIYRIRIGGSVTLSSRQRRPEELRNIVSSFSYAELDAEHIQFDQAMKP